MARKTYINLAGTAYVAELQDTPVHSPNGMHKGLLFTINNKKGETVGCLSAYLSITTRAIWSHQMELTHEFEENLFLRILPHVPFPADISDFTSIYSSCVQLYIDPSDTRYIQDKKVQYVRSQDTPKELVNNLVFNGEVDEDKVEKDILTYLYGVHMEDHMIYTSTGELAKALFLEEKTVFRCLKYLSDYGHIEGKATVDAAGFAFSKISTPGVRYVRSNFKQIHAGTEVIYVMGDLIGKDKITTNIQGDGNQNIVNSTVSNSFNMNQVYQKVDALKEAIDKDYTGVDKQVIIGQVEEIKTLAAEKENFPKIREMLGGLMTRTAEFATIGAACVELFKLFSGGS